MAEVTTVNSQITDAITQANVTTLGNAPAQAIAILYTPVSQALALSAANAVTQQQHANMLMDAVMARAVALIVGPARDRPSGERAAR